MIAQRNDQGLYEIQLVVKGNKKQRTVRGIIDTGSSECACTYPVITTLQIRPVDFARAQFFNHVTRCLIYEATIEFDELRKKIPIFRVPDIHGGIDFVIGMSVLNDCSIRKNGELMVIEWLEKSD